MKIVFFYPTTRKAARETVEHRATGEIKCLSDLKKDNENSRAAIRRNNAASVVLRC